jgi:hypothetical protein
MSPNLELKLKFKRVAVCLFHPAFGWWRRNICGYPPPPEPGQAEKNYDISHDEVITNNIDGGEVTIMIEP